MIQFTLEVKGEAEMKVRGGSQSNETILLVEDEEMLLELVKTVLEEEGFHVLSAKDCEEALDLYNHHRNEIAVVVSDMGLPKLSGWEVLHKMREINPNAKVILASGYSDPKIESEMMKEGAKDYVAKPYDTDEISRKIREVIEGK